METYYPGDVLNTLRLGVVTYLGPGETPYQLTVLLRDKVTTVNTNSVIRVIGRMGLRLGDVVKVKRNGKLGTILGFRSDGYCDVSIDGWHELEPPMALTKYAGVGDIINCRLKLLPSDGSGYSNVMLLEAIGD